MVRSSSSVRSDERPASEKTNPGILAVLPMRVSASVSPATTVNPNASNHVALELENLVVRFAHWMGVSTLLDTKYVGNGLSAAISSAVAIKN